jgi:hypothetical protein
VDAGQGSPIAFVPNPCSTARIDSWCPSLRTLSIRAHRPAVRPATIRTAISLSKSITGGVPKSKKPAVRALNSVASCTTRTPTSQTPVSPRIPPDCLNGMAGPVKAGTHPPSTHAPPPMLSKGSGPVQAAAGLPQRNPGGSHPPLQQTPPPNKANGSRVEHVRGDGGGGGGEGGGGTGAVLHAMPGGSQPPLQQVPPPSEANGSGIEQPLCAEPSVCASNVNAVTHSARRACTVHVGFDRFRARTG